MFRKKMNTYQKQQKEWKSKTEIMVSFDIRKRFPFNRKDMITGGSDSLVLGSLLGNSLHAQVIIQNPKIN